MKKSQLVGGGYFLYKLRVAVDVKGSAVVFGPKIQYSKNIIKVK